MSNFAKSYQIVLKCGVHFIQLLDTQQLVYLYEVIVSNQQLYYKSTYIHVAFRWYWKLPYKHAKMQKARHKKPCHLVPDMHNKTCQITSPLTALINKLLQLLPLIFSLTFTATQPKYLHPALHMLNPPLTSVTMVTG